MHIITLAAYIAAHHITMRAVRIPPRNNNHRLQAVANEWRCILSRVDTYQQRYGAALDKHVTRPTLTVTHVSPLQPAVADVLAFLTHRCAGVQDKTFEHWAADMCLDADSRRVERDYQLRKAEAERLRQWLRTGDYAYNTLLYKVEGK